jgi:hypothetical protein
MHRRSRVLPLLTTQLTPVLGPPFFRRIMSSIDFRHVFVGHVFPWIGIPWVTGAEPPRVTMCTESGSAVQDGRAGVGGGGWMLELVAKEVSGSWY